MENKSEQIPEEIFTWLETMRFDELDEVQKQQALEYFSEEEYREIYASMNVIARAQLHDESSGQEKIRSSLLKIFDVKHKPNKKVIRISHIALWRAASILLLFACAALVFFLLRQGKQASGAPVSSRDTIYIIREAQSVPVYDTAMQAEAAVTSVKAEKYHSNTPARNTEAAKIHSHPGDIRIPSWDDVNSRANRPKHNSVKDDSLVKEYSVRTM
jgi:hypothetical protein